MSFAKLEIASQLKGSIFNNQTDDYENSVNVIEIDREISFKSQNLPIAITIRDRDNKTVISVNLKENEAKLMAEFILSIINAK